MHARARPSAVLLYGALVAHTLGSAGNYLFAKRALLEIPALPLGLLRFAGASVLLTILLRAGSPARTAAPAPRGVEEAFLPLAGRRSGEPGSLPLRPAALDGLARGAALHADAALRASPSADADR